MAAPTIVEVMDGIETRLATITGLRTNSEIPDQINPPEAIVGVPDIPDYNVTFGGGRFELAPTVTVLTSRTLDRVGQRQLAGYLNPTGSTSIRTAIEADITLGGKVDYCIVKAARKVTIKNANGIDYYGVEFTLEVVGQGA